MPDIIKISEGISYIPATDSPLSADIGIIEGREHLWLFDVGSSVSVAREIDSLEKPKNAVISHFHPDHMGCLKEISFDEIFLGANTLRYAGIGTTVEGDVYIEDGVKLHIFHLPSCHAKGSLGLEIGDYAFLGDGTYPSMKKNRACYNSSLLKEEITVLKGLSAKYFLQSHSKTFIRKKEDVIAELEKIYSLRNPKESYIFLD